MTDRTTSKKEKEIAPDYIGHRQRLRDRFLQNGGKDMPDYEFLEFLLTISIPRRDVKPLAKELIRRFETFAGVVNASSQDLLACDGVKETTLAMLKVVKEGAIRMQWQTLQNEDAPIINSWDTMIEYLRSAMSYGTVEEFRVIYLDAKLRVMDFEVQQRGTIDQVSVHPREVIKAAMLKGASSLILVHNHPSGDVKPSRADIEITRIINEAAKLVNIRLFDHVIISKSSYYSFRTHGAIT